MGGGGGVESRNAYSVLHCDVPHKDLVQMGRMNYIVSASVVCWNTYALHHPTLYS